jgi:hypothetical protein
MRSQESSTRTGVGVAVALLALCVLAPACPSRAEEAAPAPSYPPDRIGRNELSTIAVCRAYVDAQREYASQDRDGNGVVEYAEHFRSAAGKRDGLYWPVSAGEPESPMGPLAAAAAKEGYVAKGDPSERSPFHGYYFKVLTAQGPHAPGGQKSYVADGRMTGGFALVAWPVEHGSSGVMTFIVNQQDVVFQKNFGKATATIAESMTRYDPDDSWIPID